MSKKEINAWQEVLQYGPKLGEIDPLAFLVLATIARHIHNTERYCFVFLETIAQESRVSYRDVRRQIKKLEEKHYLFVYEEARRGQHHIYMLPAYRPGYQFQFFSPIEFNGRYYHYRDPKHPRLKKGDLHVMEAQAPKSATATQEGRVGTDDPLFARYRKGRRAQSDPRVD